MMPANAPALKPAKSDARQPDQTRRKIVKTAEKLMWYHGYDAASLNDVVKKAGVSKGAFFHYYPSKQAIALEVLDKYAAEQLFAPLDKYMKAHASVKAGLMAWLQNMFEVFARGNFKGGCLLGNTTLGLSDRDDEIREKVKSLFLQWENQMTGYLRAAHRDGALAMEPRQFARLLIAQVQGVIMLSKAHKDSIRSSREFQAVGQLITRLLKD